MLDPVHQACNLFSAGNAEDWCALLIDTLIA
jgi:hypothetical protein